MTHEPQEESGIKPRWFCQKMFGDLKEAIETLAKSHARCSRETVAELNKVKTEQAVMKKEIAIYVGIAASAAVYLAELVKGIFLK